MVLKLSRLKREICEKLDGRFQFLTPVRVSTIPEENAIVLRQKYIYPWKRSADRWAKLCLQELQREHPEQTFTVLRTEKIDIGVFEAVIKVE